MTAQSLALFAGVALLNVLTPGPNMIFVASQSMTAGRTAGVCALLGVALAFLIHALAASVGLAVIVAQTTHLLVVMHWLSVGLLLWMALRAWRSSLPLPASGSSPLRRPQRWLKVFVAGFLICAANPMVLMFFLLLFPQFIAVGHATPVMQQTLALGLIYLAVSVSVYLCVMLGAARAAAWLARHPCWHVAQRAVTALAFSALAMRLMLSPPA